MKINKYLFKHILEYVNDLKILFQLIKFSKKLQNIYSIGRNSKYFKMLSDIFGQNYTMNKSIMYSNYIKFIKQVDDPIEIYNDDKYYINFLFFFDHFTNKNREKIMYTYDDKHITLPNLLEGMVVKDGKMHLNFYDEEVCNSLFELKQQRLVKQLVHPYKIVAFNFNNIFNLKIQFCFTVEDKFKLFAKLKNLKSLSLIISSFFNINDNIEKNMFNLEKNLDLEDLCLDFSKISLYGMDMQKFEEFFKKVLFSLKNEKIKNCEFIVVKTFQQIKENECFKLFIEKNNSLKKCTLVIKDYSSSEKIEFIK